MAVLIDTNFLLAMMVTKDIHHRQAQETAATLNTTFILPIPVLPELFYMIAVHVNYRAAVNAYNNLQTGRFQIEPLTPDDRARMGEIMIKYLDAEFDFVDMALMALSERLNISQICTFDRRDFSIFRPKHTPYLELLP
jgi:uncharacterized protein